MMTPQAGHSRFDTVLKMLLIAFVSLLAFSSGVYFGREMTEKDYKFKAAEAEFDSHSKEPASEKHEDYALTEEADPVTNEDVETLTNNAVAAHAPAAAEDHGHAEKSAKVDAHAEKAPKADTHAEKREVASAHAEEKHEAAPAKHEVAHAKPAAAPKTAKPDLKQVQEAARRVASNETPSTQVQQKPASENRVPQSLPKSVGAAKDIEFTVQVASYPSLDEAKSHANKLVSKGFPAYPVEAQIKGKSWYRVSVGSFKSQKEAGDYRATLMKEADLKSAIVQKIQH